MSIGETAVDQDVVGFDVYHSSALEASMKSSALTQMNHVFLMRRSYGLECGVQDLATRLHRDVLPGQPQKVIRKVLVHKDTLIRDRVDWQSQERARVTAEMW